MHIDSFLFHVAGVTFNNDDGSSRQRYISKLYDGQRLFLVPFEYEGSPAYHVVDCYDHCIGNVPSSYINDVRTHLSAGHKLECCVFERLGYDENGHRIDGYNLGIEVGVDVYDDRPEPVTDTESVETDTKQPKPIESTIKSKQKKNTGRIMVAFGIICAINAVLVLNPITAILSVIFLYFGIRRYSNYKSSK